MGKLFAMAKQLGDGEDYDTLIGRYGTAYNRYTLYHNKQILEQGLQQMLNGLRYNFPLKTSEVKFTDRVYIPDNTLLAGMYLGHFGAGYEYPSLLVSWKNTGREAAILVHDGDRRSLHVSVYNFGQPRSVQMRTWQLEPGVYQLSTGLNKNDNDNIDEVLTTDTVNITERVKDLTLTLPGRQLLVVEVKQLRAYHSSAQQLADLALAENDITMQTGVQPHTYVVQAGVHNIGNITATNVKVYVSVQLQEGRTLTDSVVIPQLEAPNDLQPRIKKVSLKLELPSGKHFIKVRAACQQQEITRLNNETGAYFKAGNNTKE